MNNLQSKISYILLGSMLLCQTAAADVLDPEQALQRAVSTSSNVPAMRKMAAKKFVLSYTEKVGDEPAFYVFNATNGGFVIAAADEEAAPKIGYSDEGALNMSELPENMKEWLAEYARQIEWARTQQDGSVLRAATARPERDPIEPMITTKWTQRAPFNNLLKSQDYAAGCGSIAMAQIMNYHKWPPTGTYCVGADSCSFKTVSGYDKLDFTKVTFDWGNILDEYDSDATDEQNLAVATLVKACGYAAKTQYGTSSVCTAQNSARGFKDHLRYNSEVTYLERMPFNLSEWEDIVYEQLQNGPVYYKGTSNSAGHIFVCDGYESDGYFHFNWGWGGLSDGYFLLSVLNPKALSIGGGVTTDGYKYNQSILANLVPSNVTISAEPKFSCKTFYIDESQKPSLGGTFYTGVSGNYTAAYLYTSGPTITCKFGVKISNSDGSVAGYASASQSTYTLYSGPTHPKMTLPSSLSAGTYTLTPAAYDVSTSTWYDVPVANTGVKSATMKVSSNSVTFTNGTVETISVTDYALESKFVHAPVSVTMTVDNPNDYDYFDKLYLALYDSNNKQVAISSNWMIDCFEAGETKNDVKFSLSFSDLSAGTYNLAIVTTPLALETSNRIISSKKEVIMPGNQVTELCTSDWKFDDNLWSNASGESEEYYSVYVVSNTEDLAVSMNVTPASTSPFYVDDVYLRLYEVNAQDASGRPSDMDLLQTDTISVTHMLAGDIVAINANIAIEACEPGKIYAVRCEYYNRSTQAIAYQASSQRLFTISENSSFEIVENGADTTPYTQNYDKEGVDVSYTRTFNNTYWQPLYVPFNMSYEEWSPYADVAQLANVRCLDTDGDDVVDNIVIEFNKLTYGEITPNTPYVIRAKETGTVTFECFDKVLLSAPEEEVMIDCSSTTQTFSFYGIYAPKTDLFQTDAYHLSNGAFRHAATEKAVLSPYRFYLLVTQKNNGYTQAKTPDMIPVRVDGDEAASVQIIETDDDGNAEYYDLTGRKVQNPSRGVYLYKGKKIYIK